MDTTLLKLLILRAANQEADKNITFDCTVSLVLFIFFWRRSAMSFLKAKQHKRIVA